MSETPKIICNSVWKIFGAYPEQTLEELDRSLSRAEVQAQTGHVIAVKDVSFEVNTGETFVVMGLSGEREVHTGSLYLTFDRADYRFNVG